MVNYYSGNIVKLKDVKKLRVWIIQARNKLVVSIKQLSCL